MPMDDPMAPQDENDPQVGTVEDEIDASPTRVTAGPATDGALRPIKDYDFRYPDKFSRDHLRTFQVLYGHFCRNFAASIASYLRTGVQMHVVQTEETTYDEFMQSLASPTLMYVVGMAPLSG